MTDNKTVTAEHVIRLTGDEANKLAQSFHADFLHGMAVVGEPKCVEMMANLIRAYGDERALQERMQHDQV